MSEVTVLFKTKTEPVREKVDKELLWHDAVRGELLTFHGGRLSFEYKEDDYLVAMGAEERQRRGITTTYRMLPKVEDVDVLNYQNIKTTTNKSDVNKWFDNYVNYNVTNASVVGSDSSGLIIDVPQDEMDDFLYQAERSGFGTRG